MKKALTDRLARAHRNTFQHFDATRRFFSPFFFSLLHWKLVGAADCFERVAITPSAASSTPEETRRNRVRILRRVAKEMVDVEGVLFCKEEKGKIAPWKKDERNVEGNSP